MPEPKFNALLRRQLKKLSKLRFFGPSLRRSVAKLLDVFNSWWKIILFLLIALLFLYYPIGAALIHNIDTTTDYEIQTPPEQSATVEMTAFLLNREINQKMWTPNLPFFFPSSFLDNMPAFQLGMVSALNNVTASLSRNWSKTIADNDNQRLQEASRLLKYDGTIWMFAPGNSLVPVPSAASQYRRARKELIKFNQDLLDGTIPFYKTPQDLALILERISSSLERGTNRLEAQIREHSSDFYDLQADNMFYYYQGRAYGYYLLLKALGHDYKDIVVARDQYKNWTTMLHNLENAVTLNPLIIRNGEPDSLSAPNHLNTLAFHMLKASVQASAISQKLKEKGQP